MVIPPFDLDNNGDPWVVLHLTDMVTDIHERTLESKDMPTFHYDGTRIQAPAKHKAELPVPDHLVRERAWEKEKWRAYKQHRKAVETLMIKCGCRKAQGCHHLEAAVRSYTRYEKVSYRGGSTR